MNNQRLQLIPSRQFAKQPLKTFPGGYVCLVRDVAYGNRYRLLRLRDPRDLKRHLLDYGNFEMELAYVWQASRVEEAEDSLRGRLASGTARDEWFDLDIGQLAQLSRDIVRSQQTQPAKPRRKTTAARSNIISPYQREINHSPAAATQARPNRMRSLATGFIVLLILALLVMPRFKGIPLYGYGDSTAKSAVPRARSSDALVAPKPRISWTGKRIVVRWDKVEGATSYQYRYQVNGFPYTSYKSTRALRVTLAGISPGDHVRFQVHSLSGKSRSESAHTFIRVSPT